MASGWRTGGPLSIGKSDGRWGHGKGLWTDIRGAQFIITTLRHEGVWWAKARVAEKDVGGDRPVLGGPWKSQAAAKAAAETFCDGEKAG